MNPRLTAWPGSLIERLIALNTCDGYVVLVVDPQTHEADAHGPYDGMTAITTADRIRRDFDTAHLGDVLVSVIRLHHPARPYARKISKPT
jgi:hypothetical protein